MRQSDWHTLCVLQGGKVSRALGRGMLTAYALVDGSARAAPDEVCLLTHDNAADLTTPVRADDGRVYEADALLRWLRICEEDGRAACVVPGMPITTVSPVLVVRRSSRLHSLRHAGRHIVRRLREQAGCFVRTRLHTRAFKRDVSSQLQNVALAIMHRLTEPEPPQTTRVGITDDGRSRASHAPPTTAPSTVAQRNDSQPPQPPFKVPRPLRAPRNRSTALRTAIPSERSAFRPFVRALPVAGP